MEAILAIVITAILFCFFIRKGKNEISEQTTEDVIDSFSFAPEKDNVVDVYKS